MISKELLTLLRCPQTMQALAVATPEQLAWIEAAQAAGTLRDQAGRLVQEPISGGLVRADGTLFFPIRDSIPVLLLEEALPLGAV